MLMAGLLERDDAGNVYNTYVTVDRSGYITRFRKLHAFVNSHLSSGTEFNVDRTLRLSNRVLDLLRQ